MNFDLSFDPATEKNLRVMYQLTVYDLSLPSRDTIPKLLRNKFRQAVKPGRELLMVTGSKHVNGINLIRLQAVTASLAKLD